MRIAADKQWSKLFSFELEEAIEAFGKNPSWEDFRKTGNQAIVVEGMKIYEMMAIGIQMKVIDEAVCFEALGGTLVKLDDADRRCFPSKDPNTVAEYQKLGARWRARLAKKNRKG
jgi:hypothetical protein